jgi:hypothetical protein
MLMFGDRQVSVRLTHGDNITSTVRGFLEYYFLGEVSADQGIYFIVHFSYPCSMLRRMSCRNSCNVLKAACREEASLFRVSD